MRRVAVNPFTFISLVLSLLVASWAIYGHIWSPKAEAQGRSASALHNDAIVVDGHVLVINRVFQENIDPWQVQPTGLFDYARAKQGGLDVAIHTLFIENEYSNYNYSVKQACRLIERFYHVLDANRDKMELALTSADVRKIVASGKMAAILAFEGGFDMEADVDVLRLFYRLGVRMMQLPSHNTTNVLADAWLGEQKWNGISDRGRAAIREMNRLGILIDIAHASEEAQLQIIEASRAPVVESHTALRRFSADPRGLSDESLKVLAAKGGLMAAHQSHSNRFVAWQRAHRPVEPFRLPTLFRPPDRDYGTYIGTLDTLTRQRWMRKRGDRGGAGYRQPWREDQQELIAAGAPLPNDDEWADQIAHAIEVAGEDHVGIGLDLTTGGDGLRDFDATSYGRFTTALLAKGMTPRTIQKVLGENWLRMFDTAKVASLE